MSQDNGLIIRYDPVNDVDIIITSFEYLNVNKPNGIVKTISKNTNDQTVFILNKEVNKVFIKAPTINPKTKLNYNKLITCSNKKYR